jgi:hypothetical protein
MLLLGLSIMGLDYVRHPEAGKLQSQVVQELRSLPLPSNAADRDFSSGYQPEKGMASRTISFSGPVKNLCAFYSDTMPTLGWKLVKEECYPSPKGHALIAFQKGIVFCIIYSGHEDLFLKEYEITSSWSHLSGRTPIDTESNSRFSW